MIAAVPGWASGVKRSTVSSAAALCANAAVKPAAMSQAFMNFSLAGARLVDRPGRGDARMIGAPFRPANKRNYDGDTEVTEKGKYGPLSGPRKFLLLRDLRVSVTTLSSSLPFPPFVIAANSDAWLLGPRLR